MKQYLLLSGAPQATSSPTVGREDNDNDNRQNVSQSEGNELSNLLSTPAQAAEMQPTRQGSSDDPIQGQSAESQPAIVAKPATKESSDLVLQFKVNQYQIIRLIGSDGRQIGPDHKGNANNDNGGAIIIRRDQLPLGGRVDVVTKATGDNQLMVYPVPTPYSFSGRVVNLR